MILNVQVGTGVQNRIVYFCLPCFLTDVLNCKNALFVAKGHYANGFL